MKQKKARDSRFVSNVAKYLARYAEPEAEFESQLDERYGHVLVVPACREQADFVEGYESAAAAAQNRVLIIAVVNAAEDLPELVHRKNTELLAALRGCCSSQRLLQGNTSIAEVRLLSHRTFDLCLIDRASPGRRLPKKQGVGLARKLGCDLATALCHQGKIDDPFIYCTDADATLPRDYFPSNGEVSPSPGDSTEFAAKLFPYTHRAAADPELTRLTNLYELSLVYYELGLAWAGSPYAYHTIGSTLSIHFERYAEVRGFPRRLAGEDFYVLQKLAKIAPLCRLKGAPIELQSRYSDRVVFGTGPGIVRLEHAGELLLHNPTCFATLSVVLKGLLAFAKSRSTAAFLAALEDCDPKLRALCKSLAEENAWLTLCVDAAQRSPDARALGRRLHTAFDALSTLQLIHQVRDNGYRDLPYREAILGAPFIPVKSYADSLQSPSSLLKLLKRQQGLLPNAVGPTLPAT